MHIFFFVSVIFSSLKWNKSRISNSKRFILSIGLRPDINWKTRSNYQRGRNGGWDKVTLVFFSCWSLVIVEFVSNPYIIFDIKFCAQYPVVCGSNCGLRLFCHVQDCARTTDMGRSLCLSVVDSFKFLFWYRNNVRRLSQSVTHVI